MNKSMLVGTVLGAVAVTAGGAVAGYKLLDQSPKYAEVLEVKPITETIRSRVGTDSGLDIDNHLTRI